MCRKLFDSYVVRFSLYAVITLVAFQLIYEAIQSYGARQVVLEGGPIETSQVALALIGAAGMFCGAWLMRYGRTVLVFWGAVVCYAAARESDNWFETVFFDDAYKWFVGLPMLVLVLGVCWHGRRQLVEDTRKVMQHPAATLFGMAGVFLCFVVQLFDRPGLWTDIRSDETVTIMKSLIEENCELFSYLLIAFAGIEFALLGHRQTRESTDKTRPASIPSVSMHTERRSTRPHGYSLPDLQKSAASLQAIRVSRLTLAPSREDAQACLPQR